MTGKVNANLKRQVYETIKEKIITCEYRPGSVLTEAYLTEEMQNSRTPVREAVGILESEGFVKVLPKKGIFVTDILLSDVIQIFQARLEIEPLCIRLGKNNFSTEELEVWKQRFESPTMDDLSDKELDSKMHMDLISKCNNKYIIAMMKKVSDQNRRIIICSKNNSKHIIEARHEHVEILGALIEGDFEKASILMREHIADCRQAAMDYFYSAQ
ncbi:GntR family transcriptional regulator [uncultured Sphaerochaeta sp.]|uniref:GntR family transcriptional regulator n=1 Tax=uncultured Sphaerochaeta sp. TaxID=886478 RepID=UPI002A0A584F|nr:GntR family transcriptional regulator [uncultured Sphaerochaeta sp.]